MHPLSLRRSIDRRGADAPLSLRHFAAGNIFAAKRLILIAYFWEMRYNK